MISWISKLFYDKIKQFYNNDYENREINLVCHQYLKLENILHDYFE